MNFSIYIPDDLAQKVTAMIKTLHINRNTAVREALEEWVVRSKSKNWSDNFFNFKGTVDTPDFSKYRNDLLDPKEDIF